MKISTLRFPPELQAFIVVGSLAAAVHFFLVLMMVQWFAIKPLMANIVGFLLAFQVSYIGHRSWTFSDTTLTHSQSLPRFFLVSSSNFLLNETMYFFLLHYTNMPYWLSLAIVLLLVAAITFTFGRLWAFSKRH